MYKHKRIDFIMRPCVLGGAEACSNWDELASSAITQRLSLQSSSEPFRDFPSFPDGSPRQADDKFLAAIPGKQGPRPKNSPVHCGDMP